MAVARSPAVYAVATSAISRAYPLASKVLA
jgi:hypothetical protein